MVLELAPSLTPNLGAGEAVAVRAINDITTQSIADSNPVVFILSSLGTAIPD
jgi:hypothetical protein